MKRYWAGTLNEMDKLLAKKKYYVFLIIEVAICVLMLVLDKLFSRVSEGIITFGAADLSLMMLTFFIHVYIPLIIFMASCDVFASEFHDGTVKAVLIRPVTRLKAYLSKITSVMLLSLGYMAALFLTTVTLELLFGEGLRSFWVSIGAYILDIVPLFVLLLMAVLMNQLVKSSSLTMFLLILVYVLLTVLSIFIPQLSGLLFTGYAQWHNLWIGQTIPFWPMVAKIGLLAGYATIFMSGGYYLCERREF